LFTIFLAFCLVAVYNPFQVVDMTSLDYKRMFSEAQAELETLQARRANLETELEEVKAGIEDATRLYNAIAAVLDEPALPTAEDVYQIMPVGMNLNTVGISVAVLMVLDGNPNQSFTAAQMRDRLTEEGYDWKNVENPLPPVHTVLTRLMKSGRANPVKTAEGARAFYSATRAPQTNVAPPPRTVGGTEIGGRYRSRRPYGEPPMLTPPPGVETKKK
jgi:hypothetical protein